MTVQLEASKKLTVYISRDSGEDVDSVTIVGKFGKVHYLYPVGEKHIESIDVTMHKKCYRQLGMTASNVNIKFIEEEEEN